MSAECCPPSKVPIVDARLRKALWIALLLNAVMFAVEVGTAMSSGSV
jgi:Co/Zn/Cd efflux system component